MEGKATKCDRINIIFKNFDNLFRAVYHYSATQTADAAYIIGGEKTKNVVAEFKNSRWSQLDGLKRGRSHQGSITLENQTMIIGGKGAE